MRRFAFAMLMVMAIYIALVAFGIVVLITFLRSGL